MYATLALLCMLAVSAHAATERVLHSFTGTDGSTPNSGLVTDGKGNYYGSTFFGGANSQSTVYKLPHTSFGWQLYNYLHVHRRC